MSASITAYDTIAAISTPPGEGAISIVRLSGETAVATANQVFKGKDLSQVKAIRFIMAILSTLKAAS